MARARGPRRSIIDDVDAVRDAGAKAHYDDPEYYDLAYRERRRDVRFYTALAKASGGPVLEYGVGNGRIAIPMARAGVEVVGVDASRPMLESLKARLAKQPEPIRRRVRPVHGDMRTLRLRRRFRLVIVPFNGILHLYEREDLEAFFAGVRAHLQPDARFVFDFSLPVPADLARDPTQRLRAAGFRREGDFVRYTERFEYHPLRQLLVIWMEFEPKRGSNWAVPLSHRQFFPREMEALLHYNGFREIEFSADFTGRAPGPETDSLVVSCRAERPRRRRAR
jgi:SAM-dependent methyltransferase